jgi:hypothetical protein
MWFYIKQDKKWGPLAPSAIRSLLDRKAITEESLVCREGSDEWMPLGESTLLSELDPIAETLERCAWSGETFPSSMMVRLEGLYVAFIHKDSAIEYLKQGGVLPKVELKERAAGNIELWHLWSESFRLVRAVAIPALVVSAPFILLEIYGVHQVVEWSRRHYLSHEWISPQSRLELGLSIVFSTILLQSLLWPFVYGAWFHLFKLKFDNIPATFGQAVSGAFRYWFRLALVNIVQWLVCLIGFVFCVVPGLFLAARFSMSKVAVVMNEMNVGDGLGLSWNLTGLRFWQTAWRLLLTLAICDLPVYIKTVVVRPELSKILPIGVNECLSMLAMFPLIFYAAFVFVFFRELLARSGRR